MDNAKRRLQAILCADAVGYSRLMGADDEHALSALNASRHIFREVVNNFDGRVIDTAGDSVLAVFDSVIQAVDAALEIQALALDRALELAQQGIVVDSASHSNLIALGQVYFYRKNLPRAIEAFETAIDLNRSDADGYAFLSQALSLNGEPQQAIDTLDHAFALNPYLGQWPQALYVVAYFNAHRYDAAMTTVSKLMEPHVSFQRWIAPTCAYLGRQREMEDAVAKYRVAYPRFNLTSHLARIPFTHAADLAHYADGLRLAGLV